MSEWASVLPGASATEDWAKRFCAEGGRISIWHHRGDFGIFGWGASARDGLRAFTVEGDSLPDLLAAMEVAVMERVGIPTAGALP